MSLVEWHEELHPRGGAKNPGQFTFSSRQPEKLPEEQKLLEAPPKGRALKDGIGGLSADETQALGNYLTLAAYINRNLRTGKGAGVLKIVGALDPLVSRGTLNEDAKLYRVVKSMQFLDVLNRLKSGDSLRDDGFMSATTYRLGLGEVSMRLFAAQGTHALAVGSHAGFEDHYGEVMFPRGTRLVYRGRAEDGTHEFDVDQGVKADTTLNEAVIDVGGDVWNRETAVRLEREYAEAKPKLEQLVVDMATNKVPVVTQKSINKWSDLTDAEQDDIGKKWKEQNFQNFHESEVSNWYETDAENEAKSKVIDDLTKEPEDSDWLMDAIDLHINGRGEPDDNDYVPSREAAGKPRIPYTTDQLIKATGISLKYTTEGETQIEFDDAALEEPDTLIPGQMQLPGIEERPAHEALTPSMREDLKKVILDAFDEKSEEVKDKLEPPDYLSESVNESLDMYWEEESEGQKFKWAKQFTDYVKAPEPEEKPWSGEMPTRFDPLAETQAEPGTVSMKSAHDDYRRTQEIARAMSIERAAQLMQERGVWGKASFESDRQQILDMDRDLWENWKSASHSEAGKVLQAAISEELGGRLRTNGKHGVSISEAKSRANNDYHGGWEAVKAYIRAKWETTQYLLDKANKPVLELYRGLEVPEIAQQGAKVIASTKTTWFLTKGMNPDEEKVMTHDPEFAGEWKTFSATTEHPQAVAYLEKMKSEAKPTFVATDGKTSSTFYTQEEAQKYADYLDKQSGFKKPATETVHVGENTSAGFRAYSKLTDIKIDRNGAASTTTDRAVANNWVHGHGDVVLRFKVPRTAVISVPAYGQNIYGEHEVILAGTAWQGWDAWKDEAPSFEDHPL